MSLVTIAENLGTYWAGDRPPAYLFVDLSGDNGEEVALDGFELSARLFHTESMFLSVPLAIGPFEDQDTPSGPAIGEAAQGRVIITWPEESVLQEPGVYEVIITLRSEDGRILLTADALRFVVQGRDGWADLARARHDWADAPQSDVTLFEMLRVARAQVLEYAPALPYGTRVPANYVQGQVLQARALARLNAETPSGLGPDGNVIQIYPLDWNIKQTLRPQNPRPVLG